MKWQSVSMGDARVDVPEGATVHQIDDPPDDLTGMLLARTTGDETIAHVVIMTQRPWQHGWHVQSVVSRFAATCVTGTVSVTPVEVPGATVARRLDGHMLMEDGFGATDELEAMALVLTRTASDELVTLTIRLALADREAAASAVDHIVGSFDVRASEPA